jgi:hypothetical protein
MQHWLVLFGRRARRTGVKPAFLVQYFSQNDLVRQVFVQADFQKQQSHFPAGGRH